MKLTVKEIKSILAQQKSDRAVWETLWQDIGDYIFPRKNNVIKSRIPGEDLEFNLFDNTGPNSLELFASMMMSILMNMSEPWLELSSGDTELDTKEHIKAYLQKATRVVHNVFANSNFYNEAHEMLLDLGSFGTNVFGIEEDEEEVVRFFAKFISEAYISENARGKVDEIFMEYNWTARQLLSEYGEDKLPKEVLKALEDEKSAEKKFKVAVCIYPIDRNTKKENSKGHTYYSHHVMPDLNHELRLGGYESFPYAVPRFSKATGEKYGRSPGMVALPEVKVVNKMAEVTLVGAEKMMDGPLQAPDDGFITQLNTFPGGINFFRAGSTDRIEPIFKNTNVDFGIQIIENTQAKIRKAFYIDQMMMEQKSGNPRTAAEIAQGSEQSMRFMGAFMARMQKEFLQPVVERVISICFKRGLLKAKDIPKELQGKSFTVKYTSFIAKSQRIGTLQNVMRFYASVEPIVQADPSARHYLSSTGGIHTIHNILGAPQELLNTDEDAAKLMQAEAEAQQQKLQQEQQQNQLAEISKATQATKQLNQQG